MTLANPSAKIQSKTANVVWSMKGVKVLMTNHFMSKELLLLPLEGFNTKLRNPKKP